MEWIGALHARNVNLRAHGDGRVARRTPSRFGGTVQASHDSRISPSRRRVDDHRVVLVAAVDGVLGHSRLTADTPLRRSRSTGMAEITQITNRVTHRSRLSPTLRLRLCARAATRDRAPHMHQPATPFDRPRHAPDIPTLHNQSRVLRGYLTHSPRRVLHRLQLLDTLIAVASAIPATRRVPGVEHFDRGAAVAAGPMASELDRTRMRTHSFPPADSDTRSGFSLTRMLPSSVAQPQRAHRRRGHSRSTRPPLTRRTP